MTPIEKERLIKLYMNELPYKVFVPSIGYSSKYSWCIKNLQHGKWAYCKFSENEYYYFFKNKNDAVQFVLRT